MIKFFTGYGVKEVRGDQIAVDKCYIAIVMDVHLQTMRIEKQWMVVELIERLEEIPLDNTRLDQTRRIGTLASLTVLLALATFSKRTRMCLPGTMKTC